MIAFYFPASYASRVVGLASSSCAKASHQGSQDLLFLSIPYLWDRQTCLVEDEIQNASRRGEEIISALLQQPDHDGFLHVQAILRLFEDNGLRTV